MKKKGSDNRYYCIPVLRGWIFFAHPYTLQGVHRYILKELLNPEPIAWKT